MKTMLTSTVDAIYTVADLMTAAALTAPKTSGQDKIVTLILDGDEKKELSQCMMEFYEKELHEDFVKRDAITLLSLRRSDRCSQRALRHAGLQSLRV